MKSIKYLSLVLIIALASSCQKALLYPDYPVLTFKNFTSYGSDSAHIVVNFTDGNGEIGNGTNNDLTGPSCLFYEWMYLDNTSGKFIPLTITTSAGTDTVIDQFNLPSLTPTGRNKGICGIIQWCPRNSYYVGNPQWYKPFTTGNTIEFKVWVVDRNGIKSNVVTTTPFTVPN